MRGARAGHTRGGVLGQFRRPTHLFDSEVHVSPSCKRYYHCAYCTVSPYSFTHASFMFSCGHYCHLHPIKW